MFNRHVCRQFAVLSFLKIKSNFSLSIIDPNIGIILVFLFKFNLSKLFWIE